MRSFCVVAALCTMVFQAYAESDSNLAVAKSAQQSVTLIGFTRARTKLDLSPEMSGRVEQVFADIGEPIPTHGHFACLDRTFINLEIESNRAEVARTKVDIDYFRKQVDRYQKLVSQNSSSQIQLDDHARSLEIARQQLRILKTKGRELAERKKRHCISAPAGWRVIEREIEPGEWVNKGDPTGKVGNFSELLIPFAVSMPEFKALQKAGDNIQINMPDLNVREPASLEKISPGFDEQSRKIKLVLAIDGAKEKYRGGLRAQLSLKIPDENNTFILPVGALDERYEQYWLQRENGERIKVVYLGKDDQQGNRDDVMVRISSPLVKPGDKFILRHQ